MFARYVRRILLARVYDVAIESPLERAPLLSARLDNHVWLKREDLQPTFSFKVRGAYNKMANLAREELDRGVIAASAGNHAQGVALAAQKLGCQATIVMPQTTPEIKVSVVRALGAEVVLHGDDYQAAAAKAERLREERGLTFIHPYDDPDVIAGQGTIGMEILRQHNGNLDAVFVAVGGGGLISGIGVYVKSLRPDVRVIGVQPEGSNAMAQSLAKGERVYLSQVERFADGVAVRQVGEETFRLAKKVVDEIVTVSTDEMCAAMKDIYEDRRCVLEPAGALAYAGLRKWVERENSVGRDLVAVACGANINFDTLRYVSERAEIGERREAVFAVTIPERPGSFRQFCALLGTRTITEFNYRYADANQAHIFVGIKTSGDRQNQTLLKLMRDEGYEAIDLTDNEIAKLHLRYMVGGHSSLVENERVISFYFPERAGALGGFLQALHPTWNISLFHYRNHGSDYGRVLAGIQVPPEDNDQFAEFLEGLGYEYSEVTDDPAIRIFVG